MDHKHVESSKSVLGKNTVEMLLQVHQDAKWVLENLGVRCKQQDIQKAFQRFEAEGKSVVFDDRIFITSELVENCLDTVPGIADFFVPMNSFFIGGTAPYVYDEKAGKGGLIPEPEHLTRLAQIAEKNDIVTGMGRGIKLNDELQQINIIAENCSKPLYFAVTSDAALKRAVELHNERKNIMIVFCLTRSPLEVNENFSDYFVKVVNAGLPVFISAMPMGGISAPYCYNGILTITHAEVLFGICAAQLLNPGNTCIHAGFPTIADPRLEYNPNYGLISHHFINILMSHLNLMLDLPTIQSAGTTHEEHPTDKALADSKTGQAICIKYGFHMIRHPFSFLRYLIDFSFKKLEWAIENAESVSPDDAPDIEMPVYDERGMESIRNIGLGMYMNDTLTTANIGKIFVD
ncbi:MAG: trimethylamine methyltransferase family protein [Spirochaetota bacterium]|nr:trimethylamine methyltransferase family protein [Spirochaetota bacterium]